MSASGVVKRDISPFLRKIREFLLGRSHTPAVRFEDCVAARTQPPPDLPVEPAHNFSANFYVNRDARREVRPPIVIAAAGQNLLASGTGESARKTLPSPAQNLVKFGRIIQ